MALDLKSFAIGKANGSGGGGDVEVKPLTVKANGVYDDLGNVAYKPVRVQVPTPTLEDVTITQNGTTEAIEGKAFKKVTVEVPTYPEPTGSINITENGTYNVKDKAEAVVDVQSGDPYEVVNKICTNTLEYFKTDYGYTIPWTILNNQPNQTNLKFFSMRNLYSDNPRDMLNGSFFQTSCIYINIGCYATGIAQHFVDGTKGKSLKTIIIPNTSTIFTLNNTNAISNSTLTDGTGYVYVPDNLLQQYKEATNWVTVSNQIKGFFEAPIYDDTITYEIGDVCQYNGKFYGYCKEDLTSSIGNAPTGTNEDNAYWEYVDDIVTE